MVLPDSHRVPRVPRYSGIRSKKSDSFRLQDYHLLWCTFPSASSINQICNFSTNPKLRPTGTHNPGYTTLSGLTYIRFGLIPFRSPLLWKSLLFSLPGVTKMFQFTPFASPAYVFSRRCFGIIRNGFPHSEIFGSKPV